MNDTEIYFLNEYKSLDNLLKNLLVSQKGVSSYIEEMEFYNQKGYPLFLNGNITIVVLNI